MVAPKNTAFAEESAEVEVLYANLEKLNGLTKKIQGSMGRLNVNGRIVQEAMGPIHSNTQSLHAMNNNIDKINDAIDRMRQPLDVKGHEEAIIRAGPRKAGLPQFLGALSRVERALVEMNATNLRSNQKAASEFTNLLATGSSQIQEIFRATLQESAAPIEPLHYITKQLAFPTIAPERNAELASLCNAISSSSRGTPMENPAVRSYAEIRSPYLSGSLQNLALASITTAKRRPEDGPYKQGTNGMGVYALAMQGMILSEDVNIVAIFPPALRGVSLEYVCRPALADLAKTLRDLDGIIKANVMTECFLGFEILDIITNLSYKIDSRTGNLKNLFFEALRPIRETAKSSLSQLLEETRQRSSSVTVFPQDGAPVPVVGEIMSSVVNLTLYSAPLASILTSLGDGNWKGPAASATPLDVGADSATLLSHFIVDIIESMLTALDSKARPHYRRLVLGVFLANCMCIVDRAIHSSKSLMRYVSIPGNQVRLDAWRKRALSAYLESWREPSGHLLDVQYTSRGPRPSSGSNAAVDSASIVRSLNHKDKDAIKDKFKAFNASFDELLAKHRGLAMEREVRALASREAQSLIEPLYARFWERYHEVDKGRGKYVKYDKAQLAARLSTLS